MNKSVTRINRCIDRVWPVTAEAGITYSAFRRLEVNVPIDLCSEGDTRIRFAGAWRPAAPTGSSNTRTFRCSAHSHIPWSCQSGYSSSSDCRSKHHTMYWLRTVSNKDAHNQTQGEDTQLIWSLIWSSSCGKHVHTNIFRGCSFAQGMTGTVPRRDIGVSMMPTLRNIHARQRSQ